MRQPDLCTITTKGVERIIFDKGGIPIFALKETPMGMNTGREVIWEQLRLFT